jgi:outer membrane beta-barrel protein
MKRTPTAIGSCLLVLMFGFPALAQEGDAAPEEGARDATPGEEPGATPEGPPPESPGPTDDILKAAPAAAATGAPAGGAKPEKLRSWEDVVVLPRKPIMKTGRFEISPFFAATLNDNLIQHFAFGAEFNYFLTDILSVGISGMAYVKNVLDEEFWTRYQFRRVPSLNTYKYTATLNFAYTPIYGKFAVFDKTIFHYEVYATAGVGITGTEIIPRDYHNGVFKNPACLTFPVGVGARLLLLKWLAVHVAFRDYLLLDKFENSPRLPPTAVVPPNLTTEQATAWETDTAKANADTRFLHNMMVNVGVSFFFPLDFKYTTFR